MWTSAGALIRIENLKPFPLGPSDVRVLVGASGVCITDSFVAGGALPLRAPHILGHAAAGVVDAIGADVRRLAVGQRVVVSVTAECQECRWCLEGRSDQCWSMPLQGSQSYCRADGTPVVSNSGIGSFAEELVASQHQVVAIDADVPDAELSLLGCSATAGLGAALLEAPIKAGSSVAVLGCGPVGLSYIQGARISGATQIIAIDPIVKRRQLAVALGATRTLDPTRTELLGEGTFTDPYLRPSTEPVVAAIRQITDGFGADYVFESSANSECLGLALSMTRRGGHTIFSSFPQQGVDATVQLSAGELAASGRTIHGCQLGSARLLSDIPRFASLIASGAFDASALISRVYGLQGAGDALRAAARRTVVSSVIVPRRRP